MQKKLKKKNSFEASDRKNNQDMLEKKKDFLAPKRNMQKNNSNLG